MTSIAEFPEYIDSSILATIKSCHRHAYWRYIRGKAPIGDSIHLVAGGAFAKGLEVTRKMFFDVGLSKDDALAEGLRALWLAYGDPQDLGLDVMEHQKSPIRMAGALEFYFARYPIDTDILQPAIINGKRCIEFSFSLELPDILHPVTGLPLLYCGRCDMISEYNGALSVVDEKTTSYMGATWATQWDLRSQFMGYTWAGREHGLPVQGALVRGVAIRKTGFDADMAIVNFQPWMIDRWLEQTCRDVRRFIRAWEEGYYDYNFSDACTSYGHCEMQRLCKVQDPEPWVDVYYRNYRWNPLARMEGEK